MDPCIFFNASQLIIVHWSSSTSASHMQRTRAQKGSITQHLPNAQTAAWHGGHRGKDKTLLMSPHTQPTETPGSHTSVVPLKGSPRALVPYRPGRAKGFLCLPPSQSWCCLTYSSSGHNFLPLLQLFRQNVLSSALSEAPLWALAKLLISIPSLLHMNFCLGGYPKPNMAKI